MLFVLLFVAQLVALYFTSRHLINQLFHAFFRITKSKRASFYLLSFLFLPGTFVHEFSHLIAAIITFVPVGHFSLWPEIDEAGGVKLGSVAIAHTDPFRRTFIGVAPIVFGALILLGLVSYFPSIQGLFINPNLAYVVIGYFVFVISNTMFSSRKDLEHSWIILLAIAIVMIGSYVLGLVPQITLESIQGNLDSVMSLGTLFLLVPLIVDLGLVIIMKVI
jgi:hypothetical protein